MAESQDTGAAEPARRTVIAALGAAGLAAAVTACGSGGGSGSGDESGAGEGATPDGGTGSTGGTSGSGGTGGSGRSVGTTLAKASDIPEGGGTVFGQENVVVTQPSPGDFKAFSATCTHAGCTLKDVAGGTINCPCHGSKFAVADGSVRHGPAPRPLPPVKIAVSGGEIKLA